MRVTSLIVIFLAATCQANYRQLRDRDGQIDALQIQRISDSAFIPVDPGNRDYQEFLTWKEKGGTVQPPLAVDPSPEAVTKAALKAIITDRTKTVTQRVQALIEFLDIR